MASSSSPKHFSVVFLVALFITSLAHARESQFFIKATKETTTQQIPNQELQQQQQETPTKHRVDQQQVDEPDFIPETTSNGYGLYGHETGQLPPSATTVKSRIPYKTATTTATVPQESLYSNYEQNNNNNYEQYKSNNGENSYYYTKDSYVTDEEKAAGLGNRYSTTTAAQGDRNTYYGGGNGYGNVKQEGMSDTRFMENGKYYYDVNNEEKYYPNYRYRPYVSKETRDRRNITWSFTGFPIKKK